jgi:diguanylate cyclase (GGDEF)-like protein
MNVPFNGGSATWLCPTEFDRARMLDMEERLQTARGVMFGALGIGFAIAIPWVGWVPVGLVVVQVAVYALVRPVIAASERPEYPIAAIVVLAQVLIAVAVAVTGGPESPVLPVFLLGIVGLPVRFGTTRVVAAGLVITEVLIFAATLLVDPAGFADNPSAVIVTAAASFGLVAFAHALMQAESQKRSDSIFDVLTGLPNRRGMELRLEGLRTGARRGQAPVAMLLCDLDHFKSINDEHGHPRGDQVLVDVGEAISRALRQTEQVYRVGGEEFLVLLPGCDLEHAVPVAERVRATIAASRPAGLAVTASIGVTAAAGEGIDVDSLFRIADAALYDAKRAGRNRVVALTAAPSSDPSAVRPARVIPSPARPNLSPDERGRGRGASRVALTAARARQRRGAGPG